MATTKKLAPEVSDVLASMNVEPAASSYVAKITNGQLDRKLYVAVNKALEAVGGKWNRKHQGHVFEEDPSDAIDQLVLTGEYVNQKHALQFFETPEALAEELVAAAEIRNEHRVLEPSAGRGRIVRAILHAAPNCHVTAVELDYDNVVKCTGHILHHADFITWDKYLDLFDRCVMNPPFSKRQDVDHVERAFSMLRPGGRLVSVISGSALHRIDKKGEAFKALVKQCGRSWDLPEGTFKESGTMVRASVVVLDKE